MSATGVRPATVPAVVLEPAAQTMADELAGGLLLDDRSPSDSRVALDRVQSGSVAMAPAEVEEHTIPDGSNGTVSVTVVKPVDRNGSLPAVVFSHGGGWVLGSFATHERLVRDLTDQTGAAFVFVNYPRSPETRYPVAIEQTYSTVRWIAQYGAELGLDGSQVAVAGDGAGGNMATAVTLLAKERGSPRIRYQALLYPVTNAAFDTESYDQFAEGPWLTRRAMQCFWDAYIPSASMRFEVTASPLQATVEQLRSLPPTLVITAEADVLRDEGEAYGRKLRQAGVDVTTVRYHGVFHDFMMLNALAESNATRAATAQTARALRAALTS